MRHPERGSGLLLMPAALLVVLILGAIAVDLAIVLLGEQEAASLAVAAANDAAAALDEDAFREEGAFRLDEARARRVAAATLAAGSSELHDIALEVTFALVNGEPAVRVTVRGAVRYVFATAIPGVDRTARVEASATAVARVGR